ncbi:MAG: AmmeMemoRadiSam system protein B [bacterium]
MMSRTWMIRSLVFYIVLIFSIGYGQESVISKIRPPARAGQFYPGSKEELTSTIQQYLSEAEKIFVGGDVVGIFVPHAGYEFSGRVAANAYNILQGRDYDAVIIVGPSHYAPLRGGSVGSWEGYSTPLGIARVDTHLVRKIRSATELISVVPEAHRYEHSVEVQIPFVQTVLPGVPIVPMVVAGNLSYGDSKKIADAIVKAVQGKHVLLLASSDMSHFPSYKDAYGVDLRILDQVAQFDPRGLSRLNSSVMQEGIRGLDCALCGPSALMIVMSAAKELGAKEVRILPYANSGDVTGERNRVVGYGAAVFYQESYEKHDGGKGMLEEIDFSRQEKEKLFRIAKQSIDCALQRMNPPDFSVGESNLLQKRGVFVTLQNEGRLRGCIGHFEADYPLYEIVSQMAVAAATQDYRFRYDPITLTEMKDIDIKISVLSAMKKVDSIDEIEVGKHGIWIRQGNRGGTYLPEVATEMGWNRVEFLEHCCVEKAGLPRDAWKRGADVYIYSSQILSEKD